jgi:hypothetical protein
LAARGWGRKRRALGFEGMEWLWRSRGKVERARGGPRPLRDCAGKTTGTS